MKRAPDVHVSSSSESILCQIFVSMTNITISRNKVFFERFNETKNTFFMIIKGMVFRCSYNNTLVLYYIYFYSKGTSMCSTVEEAVTGSALYLYNTDYPNPIRKPDTACPCSVEATSCSSQINVYLIHFQLEDEEACTNTQQFIIDDIDSSHTLTCSNNTGYTITHILTSASNYITTTLRNPAEINDGRIWIGFKGMGSVV